MRQGSTVAALASARGQVGRSGRGIRIDMRLAIALPAALALMTGACGNRDGAPAAAAVTPLPGEVGLPEVRPGDFWEYEVRGGEAPARWSVEVGEVHGGGRFRARTVHPDRTGGGERAQEVEYAGPWNLVQPVPGQNLRYLEFPLHQGKRWTSTAVGPGEMTRTLVQEVQGQESLMLAGAGVDCVRVQGVETTTTIGPPGIAVPAPITIWYCPELRAVGRVLVAVPMAPVVTHTLVGHRRAG